MIKSVKLLYFGWQNGMYIIKHLGKVILCYVFLSKATNMCIYFIFLSKNNIFMIKYIYLQLYHYVQITKKRKNCAVSHQFLNDAFYNLGDVCASYHLWRFYYL